MTYRTSDEELINKTFEIPKLNQKIAHSEVHGICKCMCDSIRWIFIDDSP